jgi:hypothetical protein
VVDVIVELVEVLEVVVEVLEVVLVVVVVVVVVPPAHSGEAGTPTKQPTPSQGICHGKS